MSQNWQKFPLGELLKKSDAWFELDPTAQYKEVTVRLWGKGVVLRREVSGAEIADKRRLRVKAGQFILSRIDARNGAFGLIPQELDKAIVSNDFPVFEVNASRLLPAFLGWLSRTSEFVDSCRQASEGTTNRVRLKENKFFTIPILLPPLSEQQRIVAKIEQLAAKVEEARSLWQISQMEVDQLLPSALASVFQHANVLQKPLVNGELGSVIAGQHISASDYNTEGNGMPYLTGPADFGPRKALINKWTAVPKVFAQPSDILLTVKGAGVGKVNYAPDVEVAIGRQLMAIRPNREVLDPDFLYYFVLHKFKHFQDIATATTVPGFKKTDVEELQIPNVSIEEQRRIVAYLDTLQAKIDHLKHLQEQTHTELDTLLPSILDKAFKGEL